MDTADDIAYAIHDLEDFHRVGVLQQGPVAAELIGLGQARGRRDAAPARTLERLRRRSCAARTRWTSDDDAFAAAVEPVRDELVDGLLAVPFDGSMEAERTVAAFSARWTSRLVEAITVGADPAVRSAHVALATAQWHEVQVLKFVHHRFVLAPRGPRLAPARPGTVLATLVDALTAWLAEDGDGPRLPPRLHDLVELGRGELRAPPRPPAAARWSTSSPRSPTARPSRCWTRCPAAPAASGPTPPSSDAATADSPRRDPRTHPGEIADSPRRDRGLTAL